MSAEVNDTLMRMILDTCDSMENLGIMGQAMVSMTKQQVDDQVSEEDRILFEKMRKLKWAEDDGNLCWMEYRAWNAFGPHTHEVFETLVDPLYWNGVFFTITEYMEHELQLLSSIPEGIVVSLVKHSNNYRLHAVNPNDHSYKWMKETDLQKIKDQTQGQMLKSYLLEKGKLVIREFSIKKQGSDHADNTT